MGKIPSVTQIIDFYYGSWRYFVDEDVLEKARKEGENFHKLIEDALKNNIIDKSIEGAFDWLSTYERQLGKPLYIEQRFIYNGKFAFSGRPDLITEYALIDFKRTVKKDMVKIQLAGYKVLLEKNDITVNACIAYDIRKNRAYGFTITEKDCKKFLSMVKDYYKQAFEY